MAGNEWINGYLEAILDAGAKRKEQTRSHHLSSSAKFNVVMELQKYGHDKEKEAAYSPTKYFVEEVVSRFDDSDLHKTWVKVVATRNSQERNNRLENLVWRIWHLARKKKQTEWDDTRQLLRRKLEQEQGSKEAADDLSELSEGEKEKNDGSNTQGASVDNSNAVDPRMNSIVSDEEDEEGEKEHLYIVLISLHGLIRGENMELGRDSDTGGQVKYVVELARALAATKGVYRVDLLTRQISSPDVDWTYGEPVEMLSSPSDMEDADSCGAYIIRLPCGPKDKYIPKESLWPHIPEFVDRALAHITNVAKSLGEQLSSNPSSPSIPVWPYAIHGHYADAAEVAAHLASILSVPMVMTGHSLGRNKLEQLVKQGRLTKNDINSTYKIMRRIEGEETGIDVAEMVVTSTKQEIEEQWGLYDGFDLMLERKLRIRKKRGVSCLGRYMPRMVVMRFFSNPHKPMILALSRPDPKKNVMTLLKAYGESRHLQELANLTLILGNRDDIEEMVGSSATVLTNVLKLIDKYDLYGKVAYPKHHNQSDVPQIYRLAAKTKGVFINPALVEPFGLTLIEAAAYGLPVVATKNGGPVDILKALNNGLLVDPHDQAAISEALLRLLAEKSLWLECRRSGLRHIHRFSWPHHCRLFLSHLSSLVVHSSSPSLSLSAQRGPQSEPLSESLRDLSLYFSTDSPDALATESLIDSHRLHRIESSSALSFSPGHRQRIFVITVDCYSAEGTIEISNLKEILDKVTSVDGLNGRIGYVLSTGSTVLETLEAIQSCHIDPTRFDALICSSGAEVCYPWRDTSADLDYGAHLRFRWPGDHVRETVTKVGKLDGAVDDDMVFDETTSSAYCLAYAVKLEANVQKADGIKQRLRMRGFRCNPVYTHACRRLNVIPLFASRSHALRYLSIQWAIDLSKVVIFTGEKGDTDYEKLLPGLPKTVIMQGFVNTGSEKLLREEDSYKFEDVVLIEAPNIITVDKDFSMSDMTSAI
ncbi:sucrose-phosphate synthase 4-like isoform X2 [Carex rostrata]